MRTGEEIDEEPMRKAPSLAVLRTEREVIERTLETPVRFREQARRREHRGKLVRKDDPGRMRGME